MMSDRQDGEGEVSKLLNNIYRCADKSHWYDGVAEAYDRTRPRYPASILARMQEIAQLQPDRSIIEIGAGPGIATLELAKFGASTICLEPSLSACQLARAKCTGYSNVEFINTTFEAWDLGDRQFDAVIATTSFHWLDPAIRYWKTAAALKDNGLLVLLWNTPPQPSEEVHQTVANIYQTHAPKLAQYEGHQSHFKNLTAFGDEVLRSGYFQDLVTQQQITQVTHAIDDYLTLLSTLSPYIGLATQQRNLLLTELKSVLESNYGNELELSYLSLLQIASRS